MKRFLFILLMISFPISLLCQQEIEMVLDSIVVDASQDCGYCASHYTYDENGNLLFEKLYEHNRKVLFEISYNDIGKKKECISYLLISGEYVFDFDESYKDGFCPCRVEYYYDDFGNLTAEQEYPSIHPDSACVMCDYFIEWSGSVGCGNGTNLYDNYYDSLGNLTLRISYGYEYEYGEGSEIIDSTFTLSDSAVFFYDTRNHLSEEIHYLSRFGNSDERHPYSRRILKNDTLGNVLEECGYVWSGGWQGDCNTSEYTFDSLGNIIKKVITGWSDGLSTNVYITVEYVYNEHGYIIEETTYESFDRPGLIPITSRKHYFWSELANTDIVNIPDSAFLYALIEEGVDTNEDSLISYGEADAVTSIEATYQDIHSISGIEAFINLEELVLYYNQIDSLDIRNNTGLIELDVNGNNLDYIDVSMCPSLICLYCQNNSLTSLDVTNNKKLEILECHSNMIETLDLSENQVLKFLWCSNMPSLGEVCVWDSFVPIEDCPEQDFFYGTDTVCINASSSPNICFETDCDGICDDPTGFDSYDDTGVSIYPVPTNTFLSIETGRSDRYIIDITSVNGQLILSRKIDGSIHQLDLSSFRKGIYFITIRSEDFVTTRKIIKL